MTSGLDGMGIILMEKFLDHARSDTEARATPPPFLMDMMLVSDWSAIDSESCAASVHLHVSALSPEFYQSFRSHVSTIMENVTKQIEMLKENESKAWGGYAEDRMAYMMTRLRTGQRDPEFLAELRVAEETLAYLTWVVQRVDALWSLRAQGLLR